MAQLNAAQTKLITEKGQLENALAAANADKTRHEKNASELTRQNTRLKLLNTPYGAQWLAKMNWYRLGALILVPVVLLNLYLFRFVSPEKLIIQLLFRTKPQTLSENDVKNTLQKFDFYCNENDLSKSFCNPNGRGFANDYQVQTIANDRIVIDQASGLMWQSGGSSEYMNFEAAKEWINGLNRKGYAGFTDWRLPTLEEAMSLMEREEKNGVYIDPVFDKNQRYIWTADPTYRTAGAWVVDFSYGNCVRNYVNNLFVRAVRSEQASQE